MKAAIISASLLLVCLNAQAINKCTAPDGSIAFQDAPCSGKGEAIAPKPASGYRASPVSNASGEKPQSEAQRIEKNIAASQRERRLRDLQEREVPRSEAAISAHIAECNAEQQRLEARKGRYVQNLYGKTDAAQAASEQAAAAARCDTKDRELRAKSQQLKEECTNLGGCK